jgi:prevent-host-death family protein
METMTISVREATSRLAELVQRALDGDEVIIADNGNPLVRLTPIEAPPQRIPGLNRGEVWMSDDFNEPLPEDFWAGTQ